MRVLFLQQQPCMRAFKYAVGLHATRPDIRLGFAYQGKTLSEWYGSGDELFDGWWDLGAEPRFRLRGVVDEFQPDLIHSHNLPDSLTVLANELVGRRIPVVHDVHDLQSLRRTAYENGFPEPGDLRGLERRAVTGSAAVVTVSEELLRELELRYELPARTLVFANYALRRHFPRLPTFIEHRSSYPPKIVYQGTLSTNGGHYDLREIFRALLAEGVSLDVYPSRDVPAYREIQGLTYHQTLEPAALLRALTKYDFGWAGFNSELNAPHLDTVLPNKAFEYLACGLPILTLNHQALRRFVREKGLGISLGAPSELAPELARRNIVKLRRRVAAARTTLTVEHNIHRLAGLYERVLGREPLLKEATEAAV
ncbi:MAG: glycosyltransferase [Actinobacteria bacterium]|nr:glycosyltransferase [Actinomycetota bacterium]